MDQPTQYKTCSTCKSKLPAVSDALQASPASWDVTRLSFCYTYVYIHMYIYIYVYNTHICMYIIMYLLIMRYHSAQEPHYAGTPCLPPCTAVLRREYSRSSCIVQRPGSFTLGKREVLHGTYNIYFKLLCFPQTWLGTTISSEGRGSSAIRLFGHRHFHRLASIFFLVKGIRTRLVLKNSVTSGQR